jgi:hypothetical protein
MDADDHAERNGEAPLLHPYGGFDQEAYARRAALLRDEMRRRALTAAGAAVAGATRAAARVLANAALRGAAAVGLRHRPARGEGFGDRTTGTSGAA